MKPSVDRARIEDLLQDETLSFRAIARECGVSDWTVRSIARQLTGDQRPTRGAASADTDEPGNLNGCLILVGIVAVFVGILWFATRGWPPESGTV